MLHIKFGWSWPIGFKGKDFEMPSMYFCDFDWYMYYYQRCGPSFTKPESPSAKQFSWNWSSGSREEEKKMGKVYRQSDDGQQVRSLLELSAVKMITIAENHSW